MKKETFYEVPEIKVLYYQTESILCSSPTGSSDINDLNDDGTTTIEDN